MNSWTGPRGKGEWYEGKIWWRFCRGDHRHQDKLTITTVITGKNKITIIYIQQITFVYSRLSPRPRNISPPPHHRDSTNTTPHLIDPNLHMFREALTNSRRGCSPQTGGTDLCTFIAGEMARHGSKRSASPSDVPMGSPTHQKRPRYMWLEGMRTIIA